MIVYWSLFIIIILIQIVPVSTDKGIKAKLIIPFLLIFVYLSLRGDFANDYFAYEKIFGDIHSANAAIISEYGLEQGYLVLNKIMPSYRSLLVLLSAFTCFTYFFLFLKFIPNKLYWLGFSLMALSGGNMLFFQMTGLRNAIAINILTLAVPLIINKKLIQFFGLTVLAYFFHVSVVFFMPLAYFFANSNKLKKSYIVILSLVILFFLNTSTTTLVNKIAPYIIELNSRYAIYLDFASESTHEMSILMYGFLLFTLSISFIILLKAKLVDKENTIIKLSILYLISFVLGVLNYRMTQYFAPYLVVSATVIMNKVKSPLLKYTYLGAIAIFLLYSFFIYMGNEYFSFSKYYTFFD